MLLAMIMVITVLKTKSSDTATHTNPEGGLVNLWVQNGQSKITVDSIVEGTTMKDGEIFVVNHLEPRENTFAVIHDGYYPWEKNITPALHSKTDFHSFAVQMQPTLEKIDTQNDLYGKYQDMFSALVVPDIDHELISDNKKMGVWVEHNSVFAEWLGNNDETPPFFCTNGVCNTRIQVVKSLYNIRSLAFLDHRDDVIIFSDDNGIYAIELDARGRQNFQPIFKTANPEFFLIQPREMIVNSNTHYFKISF